ncbi:MAG: peptide-methionine (R)-S-oxide reductase MsrB [Chitinophagales bacterium]
MSHLKTFPLIAIALLTIISCGQSQTNTQTSTKVDNVAYNPNEVFDGNKILRTDAEWESVLTDLQYYVSRQQGTERAYTDAYWNSKEKGIYYCIACNLPLFSSETKFNSGTGWPSFYQPINEKNVATTVDYAIGYARTEVHCARCDGHLGHIFDDAPDQPTGLRYCINGAVLHLEKE